MEVGSYFKVTAEILTRVPCFARCVVEVSLAETYFLVETKKPITTRNPEWTDCFGNDAGTIKLKRQEYIDIMKAVDGTKNSRRVFGEPTHDAGLAPRNIGRVRDDIDHREKLSHSKQTLLERMEFLASSKNWTNAKLQMLLDDPDVLKQWSVISEGATMLKDKAKEDEDERWISKQKLRTWQAQLMAELEEEFEQPNDRSVNWVFDTKGNSGKTWLARLLYRMNPTTTAWVHNAATKDIMKLLCDKTHDLSCVFFDFSRCNLERINWDAIERIKNGMIMSTKYDVSSSIIDPPCVVCFANFPPDLTKLSLDRWNVFEVFNGHLYKRPVLGNIEEQPELGDKSEVVIEIAGPLWGRKFEVEDPPPPPNAFNLLKCKKIPPVRNSKKKTPPSTPKPQPDAVPLHLVTEDDEPRCYPCGILRASGQAVRPLMECAACRLLAKKLANQ